MSEAYFSLAREASEHSTCAKTKTGAVIAKNGKIISRGFNLCAPDGVKYGEDVTECPRMKTKTGTNYELCSLMHAEVMACLNIWPERPPGTLGKFAGHIPLTKSEIQVAFSVKELRELDGATLYLVGHYWACDNCVKFLGAVGIPKENIKFDLITSSETKERYNKEGLV